MQGKVERRKEIKENLKPENNKKKKAENLSKPSQKTLKPFRYTFVSIEETSLRVQRTLKKKSILSIPDKNPRYKQR